MSALRAKTGKIGHKRKSGPGLDAWSVVGYSSAEGIDLLGLQEALEEHQFYRQVTGVECKALTHPVDSRSPSLKTWRRSVFTSPTPSSTGSRSR